MPEKDIVILYHAKCPDGFGAAYAAWKKFGEAADYIPVKHGAPPPPGLEGREVYLVDFCFEEPGQMEALLKETKKLVVLDHHQTTKAAVESVPEHVYDEERSGASIAWAYFHPDAPQLRLMAYLEDGDLYRYALPETRSVFTYLIVQPDDFQVWDKIANDLERDGSRERLLMKADDYNEFFEALSAQAVANAKKVRFEGYEVYFSATHPSITMKSYVAHLLYEKLPPFALVVTAHPDGYGVSIRGDGSVDVSKIAEKYDGGGHTNSAGFFIPNTAPVPWVEIEN